MDIVFYIVSRYTSTEKERHICLYLDAYYAHQYMIKNHTQFLLTENYNRHTIDTLNIDDKDIWYVVFHQGEQEDYIVACFKDSVDATEFIETSDNPHLILSKKSWEDIKNILKSYE